MKDYDKEVKIKRTSYIRIFPGYQAALLRETHSARLRKCRVESARIDGGGRGALRWTTLAGLWEGPTRPLESVGNSTPLFSWQ